VVTADAAQAQEDGAAATGNVLANDRDGDTGAVLAIAAPGSYAGAYGTLVLAQDGSYSYTLNQGDARIQSLGEGATLAESFDFAVTDALASSAATLAITILGTNDAPVVTLDVAEAAEDGAPVTGNVLANDRDADAATQLTVLAAGTYAGAYGSLVLAADGSYTYSLADSLAVEALAQGSSVHEHFGYLVTDGLAQVAASLDITVNGANDAPVVTADSASVGATSKVAATGNVLANDRDVDAGTELKVLAAGTHAGTYGSLVLAQDGSYSYVVDNENAAVKALQLGQSLVERFAYQATDGIAHTASNLAITINGEASKPVLAADTVSIKEDQLFAFGNVLANDSVRNLKVAMDIDVGSYGVVAMGTNGAFVYSLAVLTEKVQSLGRDASVVDHFDYQVSYAGTALSAALDVTVLGQNDAPTLSKALADKYINFNKAFSFQLPAKSFTDIDKGDVLTLKATLANGAALPSWLKFDAATGSFSGMAPKQVSAFEVRVTATDKVAATGSTVGSLSVSDVFRLSVDHGNNGFGNGLDAAPPGQEFDKDSGVYRGSEGGGLDALLVGVRGWSGLDFLLN
jgi:VCBS repeat-containing protein